MNYQYPSILKFGMVAATYKIELLLFYYNLIIYYLCVFKLKVSKLPFHEIDAFLLCSKRNKIKNKICEFKYRILFVIRFFVIVLIKCFINKRFQFQRIKSILNMRIAHRSTLAQYENFLLLPNVCVYLCVQRIYCYASEWLWHRQISK